MSSLITKKYTDLTRVTSLADSDLIALHNGSSLVAATVGTFKTAFGISSHIADSTIHITASERSSWNAKASTDVASASNNGLMSIADFIKLEGIQNNANNYTHPTYTAKSNGLYKVTIDTQGHVSATTAVAKADITALGIPAQDTTYSVATTSANGLMSSTDKTRIDDLYGKFGTNNAGSHNSIYRGKSLGTSVTAAQWAAIKAGTFDDMYIGDYWTINSVVYRIAAFDYYYNTGDTACTVHHITVVPDSNLDTKRMEATNITTNGYAGSEMRLTNLATAKATITSAFGAAHILKYRDYLTTASSNGHASAGSWYDCDVELMTEAQVYGTNHHRATSNGSTYYYNYTVAKSILPLFAHNPQLSCNREWWWLRDICTSAHFAHVYGTGYCCLDPASGARGVRPCVNLYQA